MAQNQERRREMNKISQTASSRGSLFALFPLFACFTDNWVTCCGLGMKAFGPSRRFSTQLWRACRGSQLPQKSWHGTSYLRQCQDRAPCFPESIAASQQGTSQYQLIVGTGDHLRPAFRALRSTHPWHIPEQNLFVEA